MSNTNFNDPSDKNFIQSNIIPIDFEVVAQETNYLSELKDPDNMIESITNITEAYKNFGEEYGIEIKYDIESVSSTFKSILKSDNEKVFGLYLSKLFNKAKLAIFNKILISITTLVDRVTQKDILESDNIEMSVGLIEKLLYLMEKVNIIHKEIHVEGADLVLKNLSREIKNKKEGENAEELSQDDVMDILRYINKNKDNDNTTEK